MSNKNTTGNISKTRAALRGVAALAGIVAISAFAAVVAAGASEPKLKGAWFTSHSKLFYLEERAGSASGQAVHSKLYLEPIQTGRPIIISSSFVQDKILVMDGSVSAGDSAERSTQHAKMIQEIEFEGASGLGLGDFNRDGITDLAVAAFLDDAVTVYMGSADGTFLKRSKIRVGDGPIELAVGDYDGDGNHDIAAANCFGGSISLVHGQGNGLFQSAKTTAREGMAFQEAVGATVDFTPLKSAVEHAAMSTGTRAQLASCVAKSETAYKRRKIRRAIALLEAFIRLLRRSNDSSLRASTRLQLKLQARELINEILGGGPISVSLTASPNVITAGDSSTLSWSTTGALSAEIDNGIGAVTVNGSTPVSPASTTAYSIVVKGAKGAATASATVHVAGAAETLYVDALRGDDATADGTPDHPFKTITKCLTVTPSGKTVSVGRGTYDSNLGEVFPIIVPLSVKLVGAGASRTTIIGGANYTSAVHGTRHLSVIHGHDSVLSSLTVTNPLGYGIWCEVGWATIVDCAVRSCGNMGVLNVSNTRLTLKRSTIADNGSSGLVCWNSATLSFETASVVPTSSSSSNSNYIRDNSANGMYFYMVTAPITIEGQTIVNDDLCVSQGGSNLTFANNSLQDSVGTAQALYSISSTTSIFGNKVTGDYVVGVVLDGGSYGISDYSSVVGNTVTLGDTGGVGIYLYGGSSTGTSCVVRDNIISHCFRGIYSRRKDTSTIQSNTITQCSRGIRIEGTNPNLISNTFADADQGIQITRYSASQNSNPTVTSNTISNCGLGIGSFYNCTGTFTSNTITGVSTGVLINYATGAVPPTLGLYLSNTVTDSYVGVEVRTGVPIFGPSGGNVFHNLGSGAANLRNYVNATLNAQGNIWDGAPSVDGSGTFPGGHDIEWNGGIGGSVLY